MYMLYVIALLLVVACIVLLMLLRRQEDFASQRRFDEVLQARPDLAWLGGQAGASGRGRFNLLHAFSRASDQEVVLHLRRVGWTHTRRQTFYYVFAAVLPVAGLIAGGAWGALKHAGWSHMALSAFLGFALGYLFPPRLLGWLARRRQKAIREEMLPVLHLLRMLLDAGLSLEHALRIISEQGQVLAPHLAEEFGLALARINTGQERGMALEEMAAPLDVAELDDTIAILKQATRHGGSLRESLARFVVLIEERRITTLREYVGKLSAKMTMVMMIFLFPALILFLAGPGFLALASALTSMN